VRKRPRGFAILAVVLAMQLSGSVAELIATPPLGAGHPPVEAALALLAIVLNAVTVEALWRVRPWATRAFGSMSAVALAGLYLHMRAESEMGVILVTLLLSAVPVTLTGVYIDARLQARYPRPAPRVPAARPRQPAPGHVP
jgi:hypothetical protein